MKKLAIFALSLLATAAAAQEDPYRSALYTHNDVEIRTTKENEDEIVFTAHKDKPGKYSLCIAFDKSSRASARDIVTVLNSSTAEVARIKIDPEHGYPGYSFSYYPGVVNGRIKNDFTYRLPFEGETKRRVRIFKYDTPESRGDRNDIIDHVAYAFTASKDDDVYAIRKGRVAKIEDTQWFLKGVAEDMILRKANKQVSIEHEDGTTAHYAGIMDGTLTVEPGDTVYPDTKLGKAGTLNEERYEIRVSMDYLTAPLKGAVPDFKQVKRNVLDPYFLTKDGPVRLKDGVEYECVVTDKLVTEEMTKREQKNRNKK